MTAENVKEVPYHSQFVSDYSSSTGQIIKVAGVGWVRVEGGDIGGTGTIPVTRLEGSLKGQIALVTRSAYVEATAGGYSETIPTRREDLKTQIQAGEQRTLENVAAKRRYAATQEPTTKEEMIEISRTSPGVIAVARPGGTSYFYGEPGRKAIGREFGYNIAEIFSETTTKPIQAAGDAQISYADPPDVFGQRTSLQYTAGHHIAQKEAGAIILKDMPTFSDVETKIRVAYPGLKPLDYTIAASVGIAAGYSIKGVSDLVEGTFKTAGKARRVFLTRPGEKQESPGEIIVDVALAPLDIPFAFRETARERGLVAAIAYTAPAVAVTAAGGKHAVKKLSVIDTYLKGRVIPREVVTKTALPPTEVRPTLKLPKGYEPYITGRGDIGVRISSIITEPARTKAQRIYEMKQLKGMGVDVIDVEGIYPKNLRPVKVDTLLPFEKKSLGERVKFSLEEGTKRQREIARREARL